MHAKTLRDLCISSLQTTVTNSNYSTKVPQSYLLNIWCHFICSTLHGTGFTTCSLATKVSTEVVIDSYFIIIKLGT